MIDDNLSLFEGSYKPEKPFSFDGGPEVKKLEKNWSKFYGSKYSISLNSATSGLYASIGALGIGYGDEVIVSPFTMTACAIAPLIYGAIPIFADIEKNTGCIDPSLIWTMLHIPAINIPVGTSKNKLPFGLQAIASKWKDYDLINALEILEKK